MQPLIISASRLSQHKGPTRLLVTVTISYKRGGGEGALPKAHLSLVITREAR